MGLDEIERLLIQARARSGHTDYVIVGSLAILGATKNPPPAMIRSIDVDLYIKHDPGRTSELHPNLGQGSIFEIEEGYYLDAVSPSLPSFPEGWENRMVVKKFGEINAFFVNPNDVAVSKYIRGEERDVRWIKAGLRIGLLDLDIIDRVVHTAIALPGELEAARVLIKRHRRWLKSLQKDPAS